MVVRRHYFDLKGPVALFLQAYFNNLRCFIVQLKNYSFINKNDIIK